MQCYDIIQTDKIISTFKWLAFEISDDAQALFWRWLDAAAWKLSEEIEEQAEAREQARQVAVKLPSPSLVDTTLRTIQTSLLGACCQHRSLPPKMFRISKMQSLCAHKVALTQNI